jgi:DNA-directed RNA polymerase specialized sigma24 family protein
VYEGMSEGVSVAEPWVAEYERAYGELSAQVFRFLLTWTNDWGAAQDLTQEAFMRLWSHRARVDWDRPMIGWLLVTASHLASNRLRALRRRLAVSPADPFADESLRARWLDVRAGFDTLTPLERAALVLTAIEGWPYAASRA